ncbi:Riok3 protein [Salpingoeca rosetta]|uniref:non-specific serine/threonine protein kinase n=1 Tax=Salpingoeca rosetta (strain ATCC 50818 / BSB-021) TaxID=946362 RepID=F2UQG3_SALR5|nr:Riok3 protein [Salpingoeca rosetta]EGD79868.1 Riok3 protein [Salpingoeca rosetta]|eukprot:XP_004988489.1 Riok3 protein [Salpingoeca rosetta]
MSSDVAASPVQATSPTPSTQTSAPAARPTRASPWGKPAPWKQPAPKSKQQQDPSKQPPSLAAIQLEQELNRQDAELARRLQEEEKQYAKAHQGEANATHSSPMMMDGGMSMTAPQPAQTTTEPGAEAEAEALTPEEQSRRDAELAAKLQALEDAQATSSSSSSASTTTATFGTVAQQQQGASEDTSQDFMIALMLQQQLDEEHEEQLDHIETLANMSTGKLKIRMSNHRTYPVDNSPPSHDFTQEEEDEEWDDSKEEAVEYDHRVRSFRDMGGAIVTKHNKHDNERRNRKRMEKHFPIGFNCGDLKGVKRNNNDVRLSNRVYNQLKRFADKDARHAARLHERKEHSTAVMAMDKNTRVLVFKMVNAGDLNEVDGAVSTGKESVIFHGTRTQRPAHSGDEHDGHDDGAGVEGVEGVDGAEGAHIDSTPSGDDDGDMPGHEVEVALKVFKTTLTEFTQRQQFLHGDRRYDRRVGKQHARKLVKLWAEKEMANLARLERAGIPCPHVYLQRRHVLVMSFIGRNGRPAPKLKDVDWERKSQRNLVRCYQQVCDYMCTMYNQCHLVHCDLSEYNILWFDRMAWIIDVGQSVETQHARALAYLYRDCENVCKYFERVGCPDVQSPAELFKYITGTTITEEQGKEAVQHIPVLDKCGQLKVGDAGDSSDVVFRSDSLSLAELQNVLTSGSSDDDDGDDDAGGDLDLKEEEEAVVEKDCEESVAVGTDGVDGGDGGESKLPKDTATAAM